MLYISLNAIFFSVLFMYLFESIYILSSIIVRVSQVNAFLIWTVHKNRESVREPPMSLGQQKTTQDRTWTKTLKHKNRYTMGPHYKKNPTAGPRIVLGMSRSIINGITVQSGKTRSGLYVVIMLCYLIHHLTRRTERV